MKRVILGLALGALLAGQAVAQDMSRPVVFVHGNGDHAGLWMATLWRFESNGYDRALLKAVDMVSPTAPSLDDKPEVNRSTSTDQASQLAGEVARVMIATGKQDIALVGNSRAGNTIRNYIRYGGGASFAKVAVLGGAVNHGVFVFPGGPNGEFNGAGALMTKLNKDSEVVPGVAFTTIRSDTNDKYAQPTGEFIGMPGKPTGVSYDAPALKGANNVVLAGLDHRETTYHPKSFAVMFEAITGKPPTTTAITPEEKPVLDGLVSGFANGQPTNQPLVGAKLTVYEVDPQTGARKGEAKHAVTVPENGRWGPFAADPSAFYEVEIAAAGLPTHSFYELPFPRSTKLANYRLYPVSAKLKGAKAGVMMLRPAGYLGFGRDTITMNGQPAPGLNPGVAGTADAVLATDKAGEPVKAVFNADSLTMRAESVGDNRVAIGLFRY